MQFRKCVSGVGECGAQMGWEQFAELDHVLERISWFFPRHMSVSAQCLIVGMMHPDASVRITVAQSLEHPWLARGYSCWAYDLLHCGYQVRGKLHFFNIPVPPEPHRRRRALPFRHKRRDQRRRARRRDGKV